MSDYERVDSNMRLLGKLFEQPDETILKERTRKQLDDIYETVYNIKQPSYLGTKRDVLNALHNYYRTINRADAMKALGARRWS